MKWLIRKTGQPFLLPVYHLSSDEDAPHIKHIYPIRDTKLFEADLDFLLKHYKPVDLQWVNGYVNGNESIEEPVFYLSFDDGLREIYDFVAPILKKKGIPATFFINSDFVDNKGLFYRYKVCLLLEEILTKKWSGSVLNEISQKLTSIGIQENSFRSAFFQVRYDQQNVLDEIASILEFSFADFLKNYQPYLTSEQIRALQNQGFTIGAHSIDHPEYRFIPLESQLSQTDDSVKWLHQKFNISPRSFAFPFTDFGVKRTFFDEAKKQNMFDLSFGCAGIKADSFPWHLHRLPMEGDLQSAESIVKSAYAYYLMKAPLGKNRIER